MGVLLDLLRVRVFDFSLWVWALAFALGAVWSIGVVLGAIFSLRGFRWLSSKKYSGNGARLGVLGIGSGALFHEPPFDSERVEKWTSPHLPRPPLRPSLAP